MLDASRLQAAAAFLALGALALGVAACSGDDEPVAAETAGYASMDTQAPTPPPDPPPATAVRVVDGDTSKPVRAARVVARGKRVAAARGVAALGVPRHRLAVRVSAPGYAPRVPGIPSGNDLDRNAAQAVSGTAGDVGAIAVKRT